MEGDKTEGIDILSKLLEKEQKLMKDMGTLPHTHPSTGTGAVAHTGNSPAVQLRKANDAEEGGGSIEDTLKKKLATVKPGQQKPAIQGQEMKNIKGLNNITATLNPEFLTDHATIYFKECVDCHFTVVSRCTKVLIEKCRNTTLTFTGKIMTSVVEIWKCDNFTFNIGTQLMTLQLDLCHGLNLFFSQKSYLNSIVWAGIYDLKICFTDSPSDDLSTGFVQMKKLHPDINDQFDQFIVRWLKDKTGKQILKSEQIVRLANGFPTTEREAADWDEKAKANKLTMEAYVRKLVEEKLPKLKLSGPHTLKRRLSSSGGWPRNKTPEPKVEQKTTQAKGEITTQTKEKKNFTSKGGSDRAQNRRKNYSKKCGKD